MKKIYLLSTFLLISLGSVAQIIPTDSLIAKYMFDINGNDGSGNNHNLTFVNTAYTEDRFGNSGKALALDSAISYAYTTIGSHPSEITIAFWYYSESQSQPYPHFFDYGNYQFRCHIMSGNIYNNTDRGALLIESNNAQQTVNELRGITKPGDNKWVHVAVSFNKTGVEKLYINGVLDASKSISTGDLNIMDDSLNFGRVFRSSDLAARNTTQFNGKMDDILVYNRELSLSEINSIYNYNPTASISSKANKASNVIVYPNPSNSIIYVKGADAKNTIVKLFNMEGKELLNTDKLMIDISSLPSGIYLLKIFENDSLLPSVHKVIKN